MKIKHIMLITLMLIALLTIGAASAADDIAINETLDQSVPNIDTDIIADGDGENYDDENYDDENNDDIFNPSIEVEKKYNINSPDDRLIDWDFNTYGEGGNLTIYVDGDECYSTPIAEQSSARLSANDLGLKDLTYKTYTVNTVYSGDSLYEGFNQTDTFEGTWGFYVEVTTFHWEEDTDYLPRAYGDNISFAISLSDAMGNVSYSINGKKFTISAEELKRNYFEEYYGSHLQVPYYEFKIGENNITFSYEGDDYPADTFELDLELNPRILVENRDSSYDDPATVILMLPSDAKGNLNVYDVEVDYDTGDITSYKLIGSAPVKDHIAAVPLYNLALGYHNIYANYTGDDYPVSIGHYGWDETYHPTIEIKPKIEVPERIYKENKYNLTITMPEAYEGTLTVTLGEEERSVNVIKGKASIELFNIENINKEEYFEYATLYGSLDFESDDYTYSTDLEIQVSEINPEYKPEINLDECLKGDTYYTYHIINLPNDISGQMKIYIDGVYCDFCEVCDNAGLDVSNLDLGEHTMTFNYTGDEYYHPFIADAKFNVTDCIIYIDNQAIIGDYPNENVGENTAVINSIYDYGYYTLIIDGEIVDIDAIDNRGVILLENLTYGNHEVEVIYKNSKTQKSEKQTVNAKYTIISDWDWEDITEKESKTITFTVPSHIKGNLIVTVDKNYTVPIDNGIASLTVSNLEDGDYSINVRYDGDEYPEFTDYVGEFSVYTPSDSTHYGIFTDSGRLLRYGDELIIYATYSEEMAGTLKVIDYAGVKGIVLGEATLEGGKATVKINNLSYGEHEIRAFITDYDYEEYFLDGDELDAYFYVKPLINGTIDIPINTKTLGESVELTVELAEDANGIIYLAADEFGQDIIGQFNVSNGKATVKFNANKLAGNYYYIKYDDDKYHLLSEAAYIRVYPDVAYPEKMVVKSDEYLTVTLPSDANGDLNVFGINATVKNGTAKIPLSNLSVGDHLIDLVYTGDKIYGEFYYGSYDGWIEANNIEVVKHEADIQVTKTDDKLNVMLNDDATEYVIVKINDERFIELLENGTATITGSDLASVENVTVSYTGNEKYNYVSKKSVKVDEIIKQDANLSVEAIDIKVGEIATISIKINENATGEVLIQIEGRNITSEISNGKATATVADLKAGTYNVTVTYMGDENVLEDVKTATFTVSKVPYDGNKTNPFEDNETNDSKNPTYSINLPEDATGTLTVTIGNKTYTKELVNGSAKIEVDDLPAGEYDVTVTYSGDAKYAPITKTTKATVKVDPKIVAKDLTVQYYAGKYYSVTVYGDDAKPAANEKVTFTLNGKTIKTVSTNENGIAKFKVTQTPITKGKLVISALGVKVTKKLTVKRVLTLKKVTVKKSAKKLVLQATLKKVNGKYLKNKKITFKFKGKKYTAKTNKKGIAKVTIKSSVLKKLKVGKKITYQATYVKDTVKKTVKVKK